jgi:hypothetical protein
MQVVCHQYNNKKTPDSPSVTCKDLCDFLSTPNIDHARDHAHKFGDALSLMSSITMEYRADGNVSLLPGDESVFVDSESWVARRHIIEANDCDGSACENAAICKHAYEYARQYYKPESSDSQDGNATVKFPCIRALGNSIGAFYVYGTVCCTKDTVPPHHRSPDP